MMNSLADLTRQGADLDDRKTLLKSIFQNHYDAQRVDFLYHFFHSDADICDAKLNKAQAIDFLVDHNSPFVPFDILNLHLKRGLAKYKGKKTYPAVDWDSCYTAFLKKAPFGAIWDDEAKSKKMATAIAFWQDGIVAHNVTVPKNKHLALTDDDIDKLSGSQFSVSAKGTPHLKDDALRHEMDLRAKLLLSRNALTQRGNNIKEAEDLERKAAALRAAASSVYGGSVATTTITTAKRKHGAHGSDDDEDQDQGLHAYDLFLISIKRRIVDKRYIDFASLSTNRLMEIKMLNSSASKTTKLATGLLFKQNLSEADVVSFSEDLSQIRDGFFYQYLKLISESPIEQPMATIIDRIVWWQWLEKTFKGNAPAQVKFIKQFFLEHHDAPFWAPLVKHESDLVMQIKNEVLMATGSRAPNPRPQPKITPPVKSGGKLTAVFSKAQQAKLSSWKKRFPTTCLSRLVKGRLCKQEQHHAHCNYDHNCAWCGSPSCKAMCAQAETL
jgi:hypothetical protein